MVWLRVWWQLRIPDPEEAGPGGEPSVDEPSLQFALATAFGGVVRLHGFSTGSLFPQYRPTGHRPHLLVASGSVNSKNVPTSVNPFLGLAVRATEEDSSNDRDADNADFFGAIKTAAQDAFRATGVPPDATRLWRAGNSVGLRNDVGDDDDFIGVSARAWPNIGRQLAPFVRDNLQLDGGTTIWGSDFTYFGFSFVSRANTEYQLEGRVGHQ